MVCDALLNETAALAHVFLPVLQWAEEEGTMTNFEGRVIRRRVVARVPNGPKSDIDILAGLAERSGFGDKFSYATKEDVFYEFRRATAGGQADYSGMTYARIDERDGMHWPCPNDDHPGTPRMFMQKFHHPDGKARFFAVEHRPAGEEPDTTYPLFFTTGRYKEHYNSGAHTRMVGKMEAAKSLPIPDCTRDWHASTASPAASA